MRPAAQLLVVSPDSAVLDAARRSAPALGRAPLLTRSLGQARRMLAAAPVDLICLDCALGVDETERFWRAVFAGQSHALAPVILLVPSSVQPGAATLPAFFEPKRDSLLPKPLEDGALSGEAARLLAVRLRRERRAGVLRAGSLVLDGATRELRFSNGGALSLTPTEFRLLHCLMLRPGAVVLPDDLLQEVWGYPPGTGGREVLRAHVSNVRRKLRLLGEDPRLLRSIPFQGYFIALDEEAAQ